MSKERLWFRVFLLLFAVASVSVADSVQPHQSTALFGDEVLVHEAALIVDFEDTVQPGDLEKLEPNGVVVLENGEARKVTRIEPVAQVPAPADIQALENVAECPWTFMIYIDDVLADPATVFEGALALGQQAESLTEMGCVGIVMADPVPEVVVMNSRSPAYVEKILVDLARAAREERDRPPATVKRPPGAASHGASKVESQWDRLLSFVAGRGTVGPKGLFLISDGFSLSTADIETLSGRQPTGDRSLGERSLADVVADTAQTLASYGWLTIAMPRVPGRSLPFETPDRFDTWRDRAEGRSAGDRRSVINFFGRTQASRPTGGLDERLYEAYLLPTLAPLRALSAATSGEVVWSQSQLGLALQKLRQKRLVWYQTLEPHDGRIRRLQVRLVDTVEYPDAPWWKRSSTPDLVAESRLRRLLTDELPDARLDVQAEVDTEEEFGLRVRVSPIDFRERVSVGHVRISVGFVEAMGIRSFQHRIDYDAPPLGSAWKYNMSLQIPEGVTRIVVAVEDLSLEEWGATIVDLSENAGGD